MPGLGGRAQHPRTGCSEAPGSPAAPAPRAAPRRLESSFSVEALLARPGPRARAVGLWPAALGSPAPALPWPGPETWLPTYLGLGLYQPGPGAAVLGLRLAHFCGFGVSGTGIGLRSRPEAQKREVPGVENRTESGFCRGRFRLQAAKVGEARMCTQRRWEMQVARERRRLQRPAALPLRDRTRLCVPCALQQRFRIRFGSADS